MRRGHATHAATGIRRRWRARVSARQRAPTCGLRTFVDARSPQWRRMLRGSKVQGRAVPPPSRAPVVRLRNETPLLPKMMPRKFGSKLPWLHVMPRHGITAMPCFFKLLRHLILSLVWFL